MNVGVAVHGGDLAQLRAIALASVGSESHCIVRRGPRLQVSHNTVCTWWLLARSGLCGSRSAPPPTWPMVLLWKKWPLEEAAGLMRLNSASVSSNSHSWGVAHLTIPWSGVVAW